MPSIIARFRKRRESDQATENEDVSVRLENKPPVFQLFRQGTSDLEARPVDTFQESFDGLHVSEKSGDDASSRLSPASSMVHAKDDSTASSAPSITLNDTTSPPRSHEKRFSKRLLSTLSRRPSMASTRSRSSSYVPEFQPIDHAGDVESQWEQRATMLARAGPPSPAIPRTDTIFDTGPPKLPPVDVSVPQQSSPWTPNGAHFNFDEKPSPSRKPSMSRKESMRYRRERELESPRIAEDGPVDASMETDSREQFLQSAIREHENGNLEISAHLFKKAAQGDEGLPMGQLMYGLSLRHGWGVQRDEARAIHWLRLAATSSAAVEETALRAGMTGGGQMKGDLILAIFELGNCFRHGWGIDMDKELARNYYETAANLGDSDAMFEVAWCYETGFGIKRDKYKAAYWYRKSATAGAKVPGMQWIWKPKYDQDPFILPARTKTRQAKG